jgi:hypothetical protein
MVEHFLLDSYEVRDSPFANTGEAGPGPMFQEAGKETNYSTTDLTPDFQLAPRLPPKVG